MYQYHLVTRKGNELIVSRETMSEAMEFAVDALTLAKSLGTSVKVSIEKDGKQIFSATV